MAVSRTTNLHWYTTPFTEHLIYSMPSSIIRQPETWKTWSSIWNRFTNVYAPFQRKINLREEESQCFLRECFWGEKLKRTKTMEKKSGFLRNQKLLKSCFLFPFFLKLKKISKITCILGESHSTYFFNVSWQLQWSQSTFYVKNISICSNYVTNLPMHFRRFSYPQICTKLTLRNSDVFF